MPGSFMGRQQGRKTGTWHGNVAPTGGHSTPMGELLPLVHDELTTGPWNMSIASF